MTSFKKAAAAIGKKFSPQKEEVKKADQPVAEYVGGVDPYHKEGKPTVTIGKVVANYKHRPEISGIQDALVAGLKKQGATHTLTNFKYQGQYMQVMAILKERVSEFCIVQSEEDLVKESKKLYFMGAIKKNKHIAIKTGKALPAYFWFVIPAGSDLNIPDYAGVLTFDTENRIRLHRKAPRLHKSFIYPATYKSIANHLAALNEAVIAK